MQSTSIYTDLRQFASFFFLSYQKTAYSINFNFCDAIIQRIKSQKVLVQRLCARIDIELLYFCFFICWRHSVLSERSSKTTILKLFYSEIIKTKTYTSNPYRQFLMLLNKSVIVITKIQILDFISSCAKFESKSTSKLAVIVYTLLKLCIPAIGNTG